MSLSRIILLGNSSLAHGRAGGKPPLSVFDAPRRDRIQPLDNLAIDPPAGRPVCSPNQVAPRTQRTSTMAISCPSCGLANSDGATECRRCRAPFTDSGSEDISAGLGTLCQRCEAYNEPGVERCTTCGYKLSPQPAAKAAGNLDKEAPAQHDGSADSNGPRTTPDTEPVWPEEATPAASLGAEQQAARTGPLPRGWAAAEAAMADATQRRRAAASIAVPTPPPQPPLALKACPSCLAQNPPAAKFCSECGTSFPRSAPASSDTPFAREPARPAEEPAAEPEPSDDWAANTDPTGRPAYAADDDGSQQAEPPDSTPES